ncbi:MAG: glutathione peroxidase [Metallibacterium scheffleri]|jgi:glutathione peroxidase|uniref:glutathione peroxidase n=1 Tax=Metallibacterium scheffleri TaxID=993689 RepID=UPI0026ED0E20|nr:glutathione peroxidase [Metallibacterium scheffleri]MCK9366048.1 glutathione peroxidase [Metallibacterium scheffleri]
MSPLATLHATTLEGEDMALSRYLGKTLLIVNVASKCGFTPQYRGLEALYRQYRARGLEILGFPCDQFGHQEPGAAEEIRQFCTLNYEVSFPLFARIAVNGADTHPLYQWLKREAPGVLGSQGIKWNFTKFLVDAEGRVRTRYAPTDTPAAIGRELDTLLPAAA